MLNSAQFVSKQNKVVSIKNWIQTIKGIEYISKKLLTNGFNFICLRNFNQDPLENFFGSIRSHGIRNINPTCAAFISSFTANQSVGANCESDDCEGVLDSLKQFLLLNFENKHEIEETHSINIFNVQNIPRNKIIIHPTNIQKRSRSFVTGLILKKIKKLTNNCKICLYKLSSNSILQEHDFIKTREYNNCNLNYPTTEASDLYSFIIHLFDLNIEHFIEKQNLKDKLISIIKESVNLIELTCPKHNLNNLYLDTSVKLLIFSFLKEINYILNMGNRNEIKSCNKIKIAAKNYHTSYKIRKNKIQLIKSGGK